MTERIYRELRGKPVHLKVCRIIARKIYTLSLVYSCLRLAMTAVSLDVDLTSIAVQKSPRDGNACVTDEGLKHLQNFIRKIRNIPGGNPIIEILS